MWACVSNYDMLIVTQSPNVPKKREKFNNYLQNNLKVTDPDVSHNVVLTIVHCVYHI